MGRGRQPRPPPPLPGGKSPSSPLVSGESPSSQGALGGLLASVRKKRRKRKECLPLDQARDAGQKAAPPPLTPGPSSCFCSHCLGPPEYSCGLWVTAFLVVL